jgi:predicted Fe-Mo cluster-binding NifX family protein
MKIVIPTNSNIGLDDTIADHFGRSKTYTFLNDKGEVIEIIENTSQHMGGASLPPELMKKHGADILLCRSLGPRALELCHNLEIEVYVDNSETVKEIYENWKNSNIEHADSNNICEQHKDA